MLKDFVNLVVDILNSETSNKSIEVKQKTTQKQHYSKNLVNNLDTNQ